MWYTNRDFHDKKFSCTRVVVVKLTDGEIDIEIFNHFR